MARHASLSYPSGLPPVVDVLLLLGLGLLVVIGWKPPKVLAAFERLGARGTGRAIGWIAIGAVILYLLSLLWIGLPKPWVTDEHAYLLGADTFSRGRLTNSMPLPEPETFEHFKEGHILTTPTRQSKYPPAQSLLLAVGQKLGAPWLGLPLAVGLFTVAVGWGLAGAVATPHALLGVTLASLWIAVGSYWSHSYWGGLLGAVAGALVFGAVARIGRGDPNLGTLGVVCGFGLSLLAMTRPYEGLAFALALGVAVMTWIVLRMKTGEALRCVLGTATGLLPGSIALGVYHHAVTGSAFRLPHHVYTKQTPDAVLHFIWSEKEPAEAVTAVLTQFLVRASTTTWFTVGAPLSMVLALGALLWLAQRVRQGPLHPEPLAERTTTVRIALGCIFAVFAAQAVAVPWSPHYPAPLVVPLTALALIAMTSLQGRIFLGREWTRALPAVILTCALVGAVVRLPAHRVDDFSDADMKERFLTRLEQTDGEHVVFVGLSSPSDPAFMHNSADPLSQKVLWARSLGAEADRKLVDRLGRIPWRLDLMQDVTRLVPYDPQPDGPDAP